MRLLSQCLVGAWIVVRCARPMMAQHVGGCIDWSEPRALATSGGNPVYVESPWPSTAPNGDTYLVSTPTIVWRSPSVFADTGWFDPRLSTDSIVGIRVDAKRAAHVIPRPPVPGQLIWPRAAFSHGVAHVVWAMSNDSLARRIVQPTSLWYAAFDGMRWSRPERIYAGRRLEWNETSAPVSFLQGELRLVVPAADSSLSADHQGVVYLARGADGHWRTSWISTRGPLPVFVSLSIRDRNLVVAFLGAVLYPGRLGELNSVFVARSTDDGATWTMPHAIASLGNSHGADVAIAEGRGATLHLTWIQDSANATAIVHLISSDAGVAWNREAPTLVVPSIEAASVAMLSGRLILVARRVAVDSLVAIDLSAKTPQFTRLPFELASGMPRVGAVGLDSLPVVWSVDRPGTYPLAPQVTPLASVMAFLRSRCR
jgi:hypothetical protein